MKGENLFGEEQKYSDGKEFLNESKYQKFKRLNNYRDSKSKNESCKNCKSCFGFRNNDKIYYKCEKIGLSCSGATDINLKKVCDLFK